ncbi:glycoside hydrolase family 16 protein [Methylocella silvestris]|uniref:glycoside hydrolase family 16 protein n=1 Tax=Methylocella silvestris TaxID=199596 RepID=UPI0015E0CF5C|nr:glycoside hydrolase family 16 protein [Methylocella silvestris]
MTLAIPDETSATDKCRPLGTDDLKSNATVVLDRSFLDHFDVGARPDSRWMRSYFRPHSVEAAHTHSADEQVVYVDEEFSGAGRSPLGLNPFAVTDGVLTIRAFRTPAELKQVLYSRPYVSGMLTSKNFFAQTYGYFEIAAKLPVGSAVWPAFWLVPRDKPSPPELDVFEVVGKEPQNVYQTTHWAYPNGHASCRNAVADLSSRFHLYGALWTSKYIIYLIDRKPVGITITPPHMNDPMYIIVNLGVGGAWPGPVDAATPAQSEMQIEWISAYVIRR